MTNCESAAEIKSIIQNEYQTDPAVICAIAHADSHFVAIRRENMANKYSEWIIIDSIGSRVQKLQNLSELLKYYSVYLIKSNSDYKTGSELRDIFTESRGGQISHNQSN